MDLKNDIEENALEIIEAALADPVRVLREEGVKLSLYQFLELFWDEVSVDEFKGNWHVLKLCQELEVIARRVGSNTPKKHDLIINIPPGTTKTIICSIMFPAWCWAEVGYWMRFITASYSATLALESAEKSRDLIRSDKFQQLYPQLGIKDDKDTKSNFRCTKKDYVHPGHPPRILNGGNRYSTSVGGTLTGFHGHILIIDDPLNPQQAASEKELETANRWMEQTLPTRKTNKSVSATILVMQRLHQDDPSGRLLEKKKAKIKHICLPGQIRDYSDFVRPEAMKHHYVNDLLDPIRLGWEVLNELESDLGQYGFAGQIGQNPAPPGGGMFKIDNIIVADTMDVINSIVRSVRYWDKAATADGGAYTAGVKMSILKNGKFLVHNVVRGQWNTDKREAVIKRTAETDGMLTRIGIEQEPGSGGKDSVQASIRNLAGFSVSADRPTGDKIFRADPFSVQVNNGNVIMMAGAWNKAFVDELEMFPNGTYKDQVDAASAAFTMLAGKKMVRIIR